MKPDRTNWRLGEPTIGVVARVVRDRGFAFVQVGEIDYFLHMTDYVGNFETLSEKQKVKFTPVDTQKGWRAVDARAIL